MTSALRAALCAALLSCQAAAQFLSSAKSSGDFQAASSATGGASASSGWLSVITGRHHTLLVDVPNGVARAVGRNSEGQLGIGSFESPPNLTNVELPEGKMVARAAAGAFHSLFVTRDGDVYASGRNKHGELGCGECTTAGSPVRVSVENVIAAAAGYAHSIFVTSRGEVFTTGWGRNGQLGLGHPDSKSVPELVDADYFMGGTPIDVAAGHDFSLVLTDQGEVFSFGNNLGGQLGLGHEANMIPRSPSPMRNGLRYDHPITAIAAGSAHSLFLDSSGAVFATGSNFAGQLGDGSTVRKFSPVRTEATGAIAGGDSSCSIADGDLTATGSNRFGQLGLGKTASISSYSTVAVNGNPTLSAAAVGEYHSVFVAADGTVFSSGRNLYRQLADETNVSRDVLQPTTQFLTSTTFTTTPYSASPRVVAGKHFSFTVDTEGSVLAMGKNTYGQLGIGSRIRADSPTAVLIPEGEFIIQAYAGTYHSHFLTQEGLVYSAGENSHGQLGIESTAPFESTPTLIPAFEGVVTVACGHAHSLFIVWDEGVTTVYSTGWNRNGQLGLGHTNTMYLPSPVSIPGAPRAIAAGHDFSLVLTREGRVYSFGNNLGGQLGIGNTATRFPSPVQVPLQEVKGIAAGNTHSVFLLMNGEVHATGGNFQGQLGDGTNERKTLPVATLATETQDVLAGGDGSCFVKQDALYAAGSNHFGQLGLGDENGAREPMQVESNCVFMPTGIGSVGAYHSLFVGQWGVVFGTGENTFREFGDSTTDSRNRLRSNGECNATTTVTSVTTTVTTTMTTSVTTSVTTATETETTVTETETTVTVTETTVTTTEEDSNATEAEAEETVDDAPAEVMRSRQTTSGMSAWVFLGGMAVAAALPGAFLLKRARRGAATEETEETELRFAA